MPNHRHARHTKLGTAAVLAAAIGSFPAMAATDEGAFAVRGLGASSCADVVAALTGPEAAGASGQMASWIAGYLSHANRTTGGTFDVMPIQDIYGTATIIARICETNPDSLLEDVAASVLVLMAPYAQGDVSEMIVIEQDGQTVTIRQSALAMVQQRLIDRAALPEESADGLYGRNTETAIRQFQAASGLAETGLPDALTVFLLLTTDA